MNDILQYIRIMASAYLQVRRSYVIGELDDRSLISPPGNSDGLDVCQKFKDYATLQMRPYINPPFQWGRGATSFFAQIVTMVNPFITPTQGFLGGIGLAMACSLLLYSTGRVFGISGFVHGSLRSSSATSSTNRRGNILGAIGLLLGGICVGALESTYAQSRPDSPIRSPTLSELAIVALAGLLSGTGSKVSRFETLGFLRLTHYSCKMAAPADIWFVAYLAFHAGEFQLVYNEYRC